MSIPKKFISCDWGTSNFRLRLIDTETLDVLEELQTNQGVKKMYNEYCAQRKFDRGNFFSRYLIEQLAQVTSLDDDNVIVASGMITSSMGMQELGYSEMPFNEGGDNLFSKKLSLSSKLSVLMVSGAKSGDDVMRGEEVQAIGMASFLPIQKEGVLILPGTHSKHLSFKDSKYTDLNTFMTGEMFELFCKESIIGSSVEPGEMNDEAKAHFIQGVRLGATEGYSKYLFKIRANDLISKVDKKLSYYYLSGLLIGDELGYLKDHTGIICMAASGKINNLYQLALAEVAQKRQELLVFDEEIIEKALLIGQKRILERYAK
ncbi:MULTISPECIES: 2-dehydro-3-deoxygalactonokinase [Flammeovirga]|uniref:2-dehydro-3-deoxygalactonokinase n=1 Tax=Flammeovirga agarivorans TaxID=2726742 RepID=A0A7X8XVP8_9BACT|nr:MULTISPECIES: 2-dehydro-3-deoxygalactonokinase [Flammeovirga]NLR91547.1 2-dehydro-3-deoxygalactonokinase [Flammeovirga agarivorans]